MKVCRVTEKVEWFAVQPFDVYACVYIHVRIINLVCILHVRLRNIVRYQNF